MSVLELTDFDRIVNQLVTLGTPRDRAIDAAHKHLGTSARIAAAPDPAEDSRLEKAIEADGDRLMQEHGFEVIRFSHPGKTKQTPGIPDRRYYRRPRASEPARIVWVEYKSADGRQRPGQKIFQELVEACGEHYVLGGLVKLRIWLEAHA